jgi:hypothetical protein
MRSPDLDVAGHPADPDDRDVEFQRLCRQQGIDPERFRAAWAAGEIDPTGVTTPTAPITVRTSPPWQCCSRPRPCSPPGVPSQRRPRQALYHHIDRLQAVVSCVSHAMVLTDHRAVWLSEQPMALGRHHT